MTVLENIRRLTPLEMYSLIEDLMSGKKTTCDFCLFKVGNDCLHDVKCKTDIKDFVTPNTCEFGVVSYLTTSSSEYSPTNCNDCVHKAHCPKEEANVAELGCNAYEKQVDFTESVLLTLDTSCSQAYDYIRRAAADNNTCSVEVVTDNTLKLSATNVWERLKTLIRICPYIIRGYAGYGSQLYKITRDSYENVAFESIPLRGDEDGAYT